MEARNIAQRILDALVEVPDEDRLRVLASWATTLENGQVIDLPFFDSSIFDANDYLMPLRHVQRWYARVRRHSVPTVEGMRREWVTYFTRLLFHVLLDNHWDMDILDAIEDAAASHVDDRIVLLRGEYAGSLVEMTRDCDVGLVKYSVSLIKDIISGSLHRGYTSHQIIDEISFQFDNFESAGFRIRSAYLKKAHTIISRAFGVRSFVSEELRELSKNQFMSKLNDKLELELFGVDETVLLREMRAGTGSVADKFYSAMNEHFTDLAIEYGVEPN